MEPTASGPEFRKAVVIGSGMMGPGIAVTLARAGLECRIVSRSEQGAARGLDAAWRLSTILRDNGILQGDAALAISSGTNLVAAAAAADIIVESVPEDLGLKQRLFHELGQLSRPSAVLASNTSGLSINAIARDCAQPGRVLTTHFWNPPHLIPLVEVVAGEQTTGPLATAVCELLSRCGKVPILLRKDCVGQIGNRLQMALFREALHIVEQGIASPEEIDLALRCGFGLRLPAFGLFEHLDLVGLDLAAAVLDIVAPDLSSAAGAPPVLREKLARGESGARAGQGFLKWTPESAGRAANRRNRFVLDVVKRFYSEEAGPDFLGRS